jgi:mono/diheme cytochrome c family protein
VSSIRWISFVLLTFSCGVGASAASADSGDDADLSHGKEVYERACLECHGEEGHGDGPTARERKFKARDFALGAFKCRCTPNGELPTDEDLFRTITHGIPGTPMRNFDETLTTEEIEAVIAYVKSMTPHFSKDEDSVPECVPLPEPAGATPELIRARRCIGCCDAGPATVSTERDGDRRREVSKTIGATEFGFTTSRVRIATSAVGRRPISTVYCIPV